VGYLLEIDVHPYRFDQHRTAVLVVAGVVDVLQVERVVEAAPGVDVVVAFEDIFASVVQLTIAQEEAETT